ncbi:SDR family oxidoreductase [Hyalangium sp.]|uniref:SDR family oxidoreductase n=1 Tax=Hyalangium sp. TaxID=2028555 RepID=UPI002D23D524|nr:SDR family oxidoreductase [Hyalangium sp.]HYH95123.1 SDR family oxidoreductase [Hyalangium sp.]
MPPSPDAMKGKVCLVTGATSGIGKATAMALAAQGATVVLGCRNREKGEAVKQEITRATGNSLLDLMVADLASIESTKKGAADFLARYPKLHVLVNQAGLYLNERVVTPEGLETIFVVNHLSYFLLTHLVLDALKAGAPSRIVNGSGGIEAAAKIDFDDLQGEKKFGPFKALAQSKLGNFLFTYELARRLEGTGVAINIMQPGGVKTELGKGQGGAFGFLMRMMRPLFSTPEQGADTLVWLASSPEVEGVTGKYFVKRKEAKSSARSHDKELAARLWKVSADLCGLKL